MNGDCVVGAKHEEAIKALQKRGEELHEVDERQWEAINSLRNRPPVWTTVVISVLTFIAGILSALAFK